MILRFTAPWYDGKKIYLSVNTRSETYNYTDTPAEGIQFIEISQKAITAILQELDFNCFGFAADIYAPAEEYPEDEDEAPLF